MSQHNEQKNKQVTEPFISLDSLNPMNIFKKGGGGSSYSIIHIISVLLAIYLSFKCNGGFSFGGFLAACCCPQIYILYKIMTIKSCCRAMRR